MATVINNPPGTGRESGSGVGAAIAAIILLLLVILILAWGIPAIKRAGTGGGTNVQVPDRINVNTNPNGQ